MSSENTKTLEPNEKSSQPNTSSSLDCTTVAYLKGQVSLKYKKK
jgi:hypothetical protein